jgi:amino acid transporter
MTVQELGFSPRFEEAMHRRLGRSGIFIEINGKYYLNEERLKQIQERQSKLGSDNDEDAGINRRRPPSWLRFAGFLLVLPLGIIIITVAFFYIAYSGGSYFPAELLIISVIVVLVLWAARLLFWRSRRRYRRGQSCT